MDKKVKRVEKSLYQLMAESIASDIRTSCVVFREAETLDEAYELKLLWLRKALKESNKLSEYLQNLIERYVETRPLPF